jgi:hypothetical protein
VRRVVKRVLVVVALLLVGAGAFVVYSIGPRNVIGMLRYDQREEGRLRVGDAAPDVELVALDGVSTVRLHDAARQRPLVLVFGSYT